jgi:sorting nexin-29
MSYETTTYNGSKSDPISTENLSLTELRELLLNLSKKKDEVEEKSNQIKELLNEEYSKNRGLNQKLSILEKELRTSKEIAQEKCQNLENENRLLKEQLKKYISAVQMIDSSKISNTNGGQTPIVEKLPSIPKMNENLQRDYSYEAEQYEKKLIQVAEMHGELMEFNSKLHKTLHNKNMLIDKLKAELIELRGPVIKKVLICFRKMVFMTKISIFSCQTKAHSTTLMKRSKTTWRV